MLLPTSIRWRLPLSYALIALLATLALGIVLVATLRGYYAHQEYEYLGSNARAISMAVAEMYGANLSDAEIQSQLYSLSFLAQARIRLLNRDGSLIADSGDTKTPRTIALTYAEPTRPDVLYLIDKPALPSISGSIAENDIEVWEAAINLAPTMREFSTTLRPADPPPSPGFTMAVAATPWGFRLNSSRDINLQQRSDQKVEAPLFDSASEIIGYIQLSDGPAYGTEVVNGVIRAFIWAGTIAVLFAALIGWFISRQMSSPLLLLADATQHMAEGTLSVRVLMDRKDEFGQLATAFNHMASRVESTVTTLRRFVADAAHEFLTPITALHTNLDLAATEANHNQCLTFVQQAQEQLIRLETMTNSLLDLSRLEAGEVDCNHTAVDMVALIAQVSELYASRAEQLGQSFQLDVPDKVVVAQVNEAQLRRVVSNLLDNAIKFTPEKGTIQIGLRQEDRFIQIWVQDTGIGIPTEDLPHLFGRFQRGRNAAAYPGSGLGLAIVKTIVEGHGGRVMVETAPGRTRFSFQLPVST